MKKQMFIAVIDDDQDDFNFLEESIQKFHPIPLRHFDKGTNLFALSPDLIEHICLYVVDLNMPETGIDICKKIKDNPLLKSIPVVVLTTGGTPSELQVCKDLNIEVIRKPSTLKGWELVALTLAAHCVPALHSGASINNL